MFPDEALIVVAPVLMNVANPCEPWLLEMEATEGFEDVQVAVAVRSCVVPSEKFPVA